MVAVAIPRVITSTSASGAQVIDGSLVFDNSESNYLKRTPITAGNRMTWSWSGWLKRSGFGKRTGFFATENTKDYFEFWGDSNEELVLTLGNSASQRLETTAFYRDTGWYHIVIALDTTQATASDRWKLYVNGSQVIDFDTENYPAQYYQCEQINNINANYIGADYSLTSNQYFDGNLSNVHFIDGQSIGPGYFGYTDPLTNTWRPKKFTGSYTTTSINEGTNWSALNTNGNTGIQPWSKAFNGSGLGATGGTDFAQGTQGAGLFYWEYATGIPISSSLRVYLMNGYPSWADEGFVCNDNTYSAADLASAFGVISSQTGGWLTITQGVHGNSLEKLGCATSSNSDKQTRVVAVEIDGVVLVDSADWRGVNSFCLPFDGNSPIGRDQSGKGNDWTPVNFGGSTVIPKATGALPILNTVNGGNVATAGVRTDTSSSSLVLALPLVGTNVDVSNQINSGSTTKVMTNVGNAAASSDTSNFYGGSFEFDGTGDGISCPDNTDFEFGSGDFTVECWVKQDDTSGFDVYVGKYGGSGDGEFIVGKNGNTPCFYWQDAGGNANINATNFTGNTSGWYHMACVRDGDVFTMYINGICENSTTDATTIKTTSNKLTIGIENDSSSSPFDGYIQDVRIYKGAAKYSGTTIGTQYFIPASTDPDILPETPSGVALSSNLTKVTDGAVYFDGTGDYLDIADSADFDMGTGDFTLECFVNSIDNSDYQGVFGSGDYDNDAVLLQINNAGLLRFTQPSGIDQSGTTDLQNSGWHHIVMCRSGTTLKGFVDGREEISATYSSSIDWGHSGNSIVIGKVDKTDYPTQFYYKGRISNLRLVKGTALYTANFTPPTRELTNITNTKLLCCQSNTSAGAAAVSPTISDFYSAGVYLTATTYADRGGSSCTVTNNGSITSSSAGTNSFGLTTAADVTGTQRIDINMANVSATFFQSEWTLEMFFTKDAAEANWFIGSADSGGAWTTGWSFDAQGGNLRWNYDDQSGGQAKDTGIAIGNDTWYFMRVQRTPSTSQSRLYVEVYDSPTNRIGVFEGTVQDDQTHTMNLLKIGDANSNANNLSANFQFANVMITAGTRRNQAVPTLVSGQRVLDASVTAAVSAYGDAAATTLNPFTTDIKTVMGQETGYATFNPLDSYGTLSKGNLYITGGSEHNGKSSIGFNTGKWYAEVKFAEGLTSKYPGLGFNYTAGPYTTWAMNSATGQVCVNEAGPGPAGLSKILFRRAGVSVYYDGGGNDYFTDTRTFQLALDMDNGKGYIGDGTTWYNSTWNNSGSAGDPAAGTGNAFTCDTSKTWFFWVYANGTGMDAQINFGQKPFKHIPPEGFQPANYANLPSPGVVRPDQYVGVTTYAGDGTSVIVRDYQFKPDFVWIKGYTDPDKHGLYDTVRGATKRLVSSLATEEQTHNGVMSFDDKGFNVGNYAETNGSGRGYVAWCWKAGGNKGTFNKDGVAYASAAAAGLTQGDSALYLQDEVYSSVLEGYSSAHGSQFQSGAEAVKAFNGTIGSAWNQGASPLGGGSDTYIRFTPSSQVATNTVSVYINYHMDVSFYTGSPGSSTKVAGPFSTSTSAYFTKVDCGTVPAWDYVQMQVDDPASYSAYLGGIEIGGKLLVDSNVTPPGVPTAIPTGSSVGTKQGFSIIAASGSNSAAKTFSHGLSQAPDFAIFKLLADAPSNGIAQNWQVYHKSLGNTKGMQLDLPDDAETTSSLWNNTSPTDTLFSIGASTRYEGAFISYLWHNVPGLQKFGLYSGVDSANGPFLDLGFRPAIIIFKNITDNSTEWVILDDKRDGFNGTGGNQILFPSTDDAQNATQYGDFVSNGFKFRINSGYVNATGDEYIYAAWAYQPMNNLYGGQSNAR